MYDLYLIFVRFVLIFVWFVSNTKIGRVENKEASCQCVFNCPKVSFVVVLNVIVAALVVVYVVAVVVLVVLDILEIICCD